LLCVILFSVYSLYIIEGLDLFVAMYFSFSILVMYDIADTINKIFNLNES